MRQDELIKKLENVDTPEIELCGHKQALRTALLNSGRFGRRTAMDWARILVPVTAAVVLIAVLGLFNVMQPTDNQMSRFSSYEALQEFVNANTKSVPILFGGARTANEAALAPAPAPAPPDSGAELHSGAVDYSTTNVQVAGVDEADIVKTDGVYIYLVSENRVIIVEAYPPEQARVMSEIKLERMVVGIFINGDRLVVFEGGMPHFELPVERGVYPPYTPARTSIKVYDISDRENPSLRRELSAEGDYVSSRMIGDYAYVVINQPVYDQEGELTLPKIHLDDAEAEIPATDIYSYASYDYFYTYTSIIALDTQDDEREPTIETILLGASSSLYVSQDNIYLVFPVWAEVMRGSEKSSVHRIHIDGDTIEYVASGEIPGMVLNQFSMDEYQGYFRVATTTGAGWIVRLRVLVGELLEYIGMPTGTELQPSLNHIYALDMDLNMVGKLENLAPGERIYSVRFMGERGYVVTFRTIDPLFVIDLKDPRNPQVLGELKVTGYSGYLHPYDEDHLIGIGKEAEEAEEGDFAWFGGVKISLFDVSDVSNPREIDEYEIGHRGTDSPVLWDHKALLFDKSRNLMVIPVCVVEIDETQYSGRVPPWAYGNPIWQGAYVFHVSPQAGLRLEGGITHFDIPPDEEQYYDYCYSPFSVERSLYIGDVLYTISEAKIKMNDLETLDFINEVELS